MRTKNFQLKKCFLTISVHSLNKMFKLIELMKKKRWYVSTIEKKRNILNKTKSAKNKTSRNKLIVD